MNKKVEIEVITEGLLIRNIKYNITINKNTTLKKIKNYISKKYSSYDNITNNNQCWFNIDNEFKESKPITIQSILTHSSGLPRESNHPYWSYPHFSFPSKQEVIEELKNQQMLYPSSKYYQYSNLGLSLLGYVVEEVSGDSFDDYVTQNILDPLLMDDTKTYMPKDEYGNKLTIGYSSITRDRLREKVKFL